MNLRNNILAFGISATAAIGGYVALNEALHYKTQHEQEVACLSPKYAGNVACHNSVITPSSVHSTHTTQEIYSWIAGFGLLGGAAGLFGAYGVAVGSKE